MLVLKLTAIKVGGMVIVALESVSVKERVTSRGSRHHIQVDGPCR
ncbi:MAG: hypothetical protein ABIK79_10140 [Chloroflexota bacterium]